MRVADPVTAERVHWDDVLAEVLRGGPLDMWRRHMAAVYHRLIVAW